MDEETVELYNGKVVLNYSDSGHVYTLDGKVVYGVTSIVKVIDKPALVGWGVKETINHYKRRIEPGKEYSEVDLDIIHDEAKSARFASARKSASIGSITHNWIEAYVEAGLAGEELPERPVDKSVNKALDAFFEWTKEHDIKFKYSERKVYSMEYDYAGTLDGEAEVDGNLDLIDYKTSTGIYPEYWLQIAAYMQAREEEEGHKYDGAWIVRIDKRSGKFETERKSREEIMEVYLPAFLSALGIYNWQMALRDKLFNKEQDGYKKN